jgi:hypothetical protein
MQGKRHRLARWKAVDETRTEELEAFFSRSMHFTLDPWEPMFGASEEA